MAIVNWNGDQANEFIRRQTVMAIKRACIEIVRKAKELLSVSGTGTVVTRHIDTSDGLVTHTEIQKKTSKSTGRTVYGAFPSAPGEPPHKQTGQLRMSVTYEVDEKSNPVQARVGTNLLYGLFLELGTRRGLLPRPWLRRAAYEAAERVDIHLSE